MTSRRDCLTELLVDVAINIVTARRVAAGTCALAELEVPLEVAHRVLLT